nr:MAG TPA: hypothetical protein [Caudoviricetes sp.]
MFFNFIVYISLNFLTPFLFFGNIGLHRDDKARAYA